MYRRALLVALVVCSLGIVFAAVQPASAGVFSETPTPDGTDDGSDAAAGETGGDDDGDDAEGDVDGSSDGAEDDADADGEEDGWFSDWRSDDDHRTGYGSDRDGSDGEDTDAGPDGGDGTDDGDTNASDDPEADGDGDTSRDGEDDDEHDDEHDLADRRNGTDGENGTDRNAEATDDGTGDRDEEPHRSRSLTGRVLGLTNETVRTVTDGVAADVDGDGDADVELVDADGGSVRVGALSGGSADGADGSARGVEVVEVALDDSILDDRGRLRAGNVTLASGLVVPLGPPEILAGDGADEGRDDRPPLDAPPTSDVQAEPPSPDEPAAVTVAGSDASEADATDESGDESEASAATDDGEGGAGDGPGSGAGAGAALVVTVGLLGGTRTALDQTALLASQGPGATLTTLRHVVAGHLEKLPGGVLPALFGYSRRDGSDPLENETRAEIYDLVRESPGTYHAQLAEETGVAVETVRYHSRILAEEGLVEARKIRGRRRLFPVTMDDDDPEIAAAIADSAASDVLSVIERREPTTLSAIAEAVDCAPSTVSYHLDRLEEDGLVSRERDGGAVRIRLRRATKSALRGSVADD